MIHTLQVSLLVALVALTGTRATCSAQSGRQIQYSEPRAERGSTNLNRLSHGLSRLDRLESELNRPFEFVTSGNSMQGSFLTAPLPTPPPAVNNPRVKELIDRKRDFPFMKPEELYHIQSPADLYKAPELTADGRDRSSLRPLERALLDKDNPDGARNSQFGNRLGQWGEGVPDSTGNPARSGLSDIERNLQNLMGKYGSGTDQGKSSVRQAADFFGYGESRMPVMNKRTASEIQRIEEFKKIYDFNNSRPAGLTPTDAARHSNPYIDSSFYDLPPRAATATPSPVVTPSTFGSLLPGYSTPPPAPAPVKPYTPPPSVFQSVPKRNF